MSRRAFSLPGTPSSNDAFRRGLALRRLSDGDGLTAYRRHIAVLDGNRQKCVDKARNLDSSCIYMIIMDDGASLLPSETGGAGEGENSAT